MTTGMWFSVGFLLLGALTAALMLPNKSREDQVTRQNDPSGNINGLDDLEITIIPGTVIEGEAPVPV